MACFCCEACEACAQTGRIVGSGGQASLDGWQHGRLASLDVCHSFVCRILLWPPGTFIPEDECVAPNVQAEVEGLPARKHRPEVCFSEDASHFFAFVSLISIWPSLPCRPFHRPFASPGLGVPFPDSRQTLHHRNGLAAASASGAGRCHRLGSSRFVLSFWPGSGAVAFVREAPAPDKASKGQTEPSAYSFV